MELGTPSGTKVTMMLCDSAQVADGKLYVLGGGWSVVGPDPTPCALAVKLELPGSSSARSYSWALDLLDADGRPVALPTPDGPQPVGVSGGLDLNPQSPPPAGVSLDVPLAVNFGPLPLSPGRYGWRFSLDGSSEEGWTTEFTVLAPTPPPSQGFSFGNGDFGPTAFRLPPT